MILQNLRYSDHLEHLMGTRTLSPDQEMGPLGLHPHSGSGTANQDAWSISHHPSLLSHSSLSPSRFLCTSALFLPQCSLSVH